MKNLCLLLLVLCPALLCSQAYIDTTFTNYFKRNGTGWNAGDATISVPLPDGRTLWMFGDSHVDQNVDANNKLPCIFNTNNSIIVQSEDNQFTTYSDSTQARPYQFFKAEMDGDTIIYWPEGGFVWEETAYTFWASWSRDSIKHLDNLGNLDSVDIILQFKGMFIVEIEVSSIEIKNITPFENETIEYGMTIITDEEAGYHYIYGRRILPIENWEFVKQPLLARCPIGQIYAPWEYFSLANNWSTNPNNAVPVGRETAPAYSVFEHGNKYYLLHQSAGGILACGASRTIYTYEADSPTGPFNERILIYTITDQFDGEDIYTYGAQAHPHFTKNNELLISYNLNKNCTAQDSCAADSIVRYYRYDADTYRPKFVRVPFELFATATTVTDISSEFRFRIFPNPTEGFINIQADFATNKKLTYKLYDSQAKLKVLGKLEHSKILLPPDLGKGVYFLQLLTEEGIIFAKTIMIQ